MSVVPQIKGYYESYWSEGQKIYSGANQGYAPNFRKWLRDESAVFPRDSRALEVGCGDATFTTELAKYCVSVTAIDISAGQIAANLSRHPGIDFRQHDVAEPLPFPDGAFDIVWCSEVLEHLFDPAFAIREMHRVLAPDGRVLITVPYHGRFKNVLIALFKFDEHYTPSNPHVRFFTRSSLERIVGAAGFRQIRTRTCGMGKPLRDVIVPTNLLLRAARSPSSER